MPDCKVRSWALLQLASLSIYTDYTVLFLATLISVGSICYTAISLSRILITVKVDFVIDKSRGLQGLQQHLGASALSDLSKCLNSEICRKCYTENLIVLPQTVPDFRLSAYGMYTARRIYHDGGALQQT